MSRVRGRCNNVLDARDATSGKSVEIDAGREANRSQVGHLARIRDKVWRRFRHLLCGELLTRDTRIGADRAATANLMTTDEERDTGRILERVLERYRDGPFAYLALEYEGCSLLLSSAAAPAEARGVVAQPVPILAPSVGLVDPAPGRQHLHGPGDRVAKGDLLFVLRRFKRSIEVKAAATGRVQLSVAPGEFVEFGQALGTIEPGQT